MKLWGSPYCPGKLYCIIRVVSQLPWDVRGPVSWYLVDIENILSPVSALCRVYYTRSWCDTDPNDNILPTTSYSGTTHSILGMCHVRPLTLLTSFTYLYPPPLSPPATPWLLRTIKCCVTKILSRLLKISFSLDNLDGILNHKNENNTASAMIWTAKLHKE